MKLLLTCEHAGNEVPQRFQHLFYKAGGALESHRGFDPGALDLFNSLKEIANFSHFQPVSRLLVETNRSLGHPQLFSEFSKILSSEEKKFILHNYYFPYRNAVANSISQSIRKGESLLHLSLHTFTPELNGKIRNTDLGLLFDPARTQEKEFCRFFKEQLKLELQELKIRFNYPYLGKSDGLTTYLRKNFPENYLGIELEVNQKYVYKNTMSSKIKRAVFRVLNKPGVLVGTE